MAITLKLEETIKIMDKGKLISKLEDILKEKSGQSLAIIQDIQNAANNETKSSAGDKHEVGRAMAQNEVEKAAKTLSQFTDMKKVLSIIKQNSSGGNLGKIVRTDKGLFFISIPLGLVEIEKEKVFCVSPSSPFAINVNDKTIGERLKIGSIEHNIIDII
jgi:hypothetical protein